MTRKNRERILSMYTDDKYDHKARIIDDIAQQSCEDIDITDLYTVLRTSVTLGAEKATYRLKDIPIPESLKNLENKLEGLFKKIGQDCVLKGI